MKEWSNPWNPFNSAKVLLWKEHLEACAKEEYLPPVTVDIDPSNKCMFDCKFCNAYDMMSRSNKLMSGQHMLKLVDFLVFWRGSTRHYTPMSACISGGGEPYLNREMTTLLEAMHVNGLESGIITTGFPMTDKDIDVAAKTARWVGFSVDAAASGTYAQIKGITNDSAFNKVIENMKKLVKRVDHHKTNCDVAFKFLLTPDNADEIYAAIKLAKGIGVKDFHLRPAGWDNLSKVKEKPKFDHNTINYVNDQIEAGMGLETKDFRVFGVRHKFNPDFSRKINFSRCWAIPLIPTFGADGNVHLCFDMRGREDLIMCRHDPDPNELLKVWNTDRHREIIRSVKVEDCPRCTFGAYNEIVEKVIIQDTMCKYFP